jgi:capsular exopolysaccharide synthesis family protein
MHGRLGHVRELDAPVQADDSGWDERTDLRSLLSLVRRHKWTIILTVVLTLGATALVVTQIGRLYTATALVVVDNRDSQLLGLQTAIQGFGDSVVDTEVEIARSPAVLQRTAAALDLAAAPDYQPKLPFIDMVKAMVGLTVARPTPPPTGVAFTTLPVTDQARIVEQLARSLNIERRGLTNVISIAATAPTGVAAANVANGVAKAYLDEQIEAKLNSNESASAFLRKRVDELTANVAESDKKIDDFVTAKLDELGSPEARSLLTKLADEANKRATAGNTLGDLQRYLEADDYAHLAEIAEARQAGIAEQRRKLVADLTTTVDQEQVAATKRSLQDLDNQITALAEKQVASLQENILLSNGVSAAFRKQVESALADIRLPPEVSQQLFRLQRDAETERALYDSAIGKLRQVEQQSDFRIPDSRVIASATPPAKPSFPPNRLIFIGATLLALAAGLGLAFLREHFIGGVTSTEQFEKLAAMKVAAAVPRSAPRGNSSVDLSIVDQPLSAFSEAIRRIQLGVDLAAAGRKRTIVVTSSLPGDGKTTLTLALARQMAMTGNSTIVIDADLRHPSVHRYLGATPEKGLIDFLAQPQGAAPEQLAITKEARTGVNFVLGGAASAVATDALLRSRAFDELMKYAQENYDVVIVDTPPVGLVVDATIVARHCDTGLFVVRFAATAQTQVRASAREIARAGLPMVGVLNMVTAAEGRTYGYNKKYRAYYGTA